MDPLNVCVYIYIYMCVCVCVNFKAEFYKRVHNLTYITFNREELEVLEQGFPYNFLNQHKNLS